MRGPLKVKQKWVPRKKIFNILWKTTIICSQKHNLFKHGMIKLVNLNVAHQIYSTLWKMSNFQLPGGRWALGGDGVSGWGIINGRRHGNLYGWSPDSGCVQGGECHLILSSLLLSLCRGRQHVTYTLWGNRHVQDTGCMTSPLVDISQ